MLTLPVNNFSKNTGPCHTKYDYLANVGERGQPKGRSLKTVELMYFFKNLLFNPRSYGRLNRLSLQ